MRRSLTSVLFTSVAVTSFAGLAFLCGCGAAPKSPESYKSPSGAEFSGDREICMQQAGFAAASGGKITFGGGYGGNVFFSSGQYMDCMVARGYRADALGDPLGTPGTERQMGGM